MNSYIVEPHLYNSGYPSTEMTVQCLTSLLLPTVTKWERLCFRSFRSIILNISHDTLLFIVQTISVQHPNSDPLCWKHRVVKTGDLFKLVHLGTPSPH